MVVAIRRGRRSAKGNKRCKLAAVWQSPDNHNRWAALDHLGRLEPAHVKVADDDRFAVYRMFNWQFCSFCRYGSAQIGASQGKIKRMKQCPWDDCATENHPLQQKFWFSLPLWPLMSSSSMHILVQPKHMGRSRWSLAAIGSPKPRSFKASQPQ